MTIRIIALGRLLPILAAGMLVCAGTVSAQTEKRVIEAPKEAPIKIGRVTANSPAVNLKDVGNEVAPGIIEVPPGATFGKRLVLPPGGGAVKGICIGKWNGPIKTCEGVYEQW